MSLYKVSKKYWSTVLLYLEWIEISILNTSTKPIFFFFVLMGDENFPQTPHEKEVNVQV